jgi:hypothetical protein
MDSDWEKPKYKKKIIPNSSNTILKKNVIIKNILKYNEEYVYSFKEINKKKIVSYELSSMFDKINDMFKTSTQYLESKKKINYNQNNHNRWELKKEEDNTIINIICINFNKITNDNFNEIVLDIAKQEIILYDDLDKLTDKIIQKCINENEFLNIYIKVIYFIITKCSWIVEDTENIPITFRRILLNQLEMHFNNLINDIKNMKYDKNETELIIIHNKVRKGLILFITELYKQKIIGNQLIRFIFKILENSYNETNIDQYIEFWLIIFNVVISIWKDTEKQYLDEQIEYILKIKEQLSKKLQFFIQDQIDILNNYNYTCDKKEDISKEEITNINYDILILSSTEYSSLDEWFKDLYDLNKDIFLLDILQLSLDDKSNYDISVNLLKFLIEKDYFTRDDISNKIKYIKNENDLSDYTYFLIHLDNFNKL